MPELKSIIYRHPEHRKFYDRWRHLDAMSAGGEAMTDEIKRELLANPDQSRPTTFNERIRLATYDSVIGALIMRLSSQLLADKASYEGDKGPVWDWFFESGAKIPRDKDGRSGFHQLLSQSVISALTTGTAVIQIDAPNVSATNALELSAQGGDRPTAIMRGRESLWDWQEYECDLRFAKIHDYFEVRDRWDSPITPLHRFSIFEKKEGGNVTLTQYDISPRDPEKYQVFGIKELEQIESQNVIIKEYPPVNLFSTISGVSRFPIVLFTFPHELVIAQQLYDLQKSAFNHSLGTEWAILQTNYAQLVFTKVDKPHQEGNNNPAKFSPGGDGRYWELTDDTDVKWLTRNPEGIQLGIEYEEKLRSRMLEKIHAIAQTAATAFASRRQSGESKKEDRRALDILLEIYGACIREQAAKILNVASIVTNSTTEWIVRGFTDYNSESFLECAEEYLGLKEAGINSNTLTRESQLALASKAVEHFGLNPSVINDIKEEIEHNEQSINYNQAKRILSPFAAHCPECIQHQTDWTDSVNVVPIGVNCSCRQNCKCSIFYRNLIG